MPPPGPGIGGGGHRLLKTGGRQYQRRAFLGRSAGTAPNDAMNGKTLHATRHSFFRRLDMFFPWLCWRGNYASTLATKCRNFRHLSLYRAIFPNNSVIGAA
jgi:hypothetical protein